ncbi:unnamed protein product, partial [Ilex paraguariensis]
KPLRVLMKEKKKRISNHYSSIADSMAIEIRKEEMKEDGDSTSLYQSSLSSKSHSFRSQSSRSSRPNSNSPSPNKLSPTPSLSSPKNLSPSPSSSGIEAKNAEDLVRKKFYHKHSPPPP